MREYFRRDNIKVIAWDIGLSIVMLMLAYVASAYLLRHTVEENNSALVFVFAVVVISRYTSGYFYGIFASILSVFFINYYFMYPYATFNMKISGYPVAIASFFLISIIISALTSRMRMQTALNEKLYKEQAEIKISAEKERIRGNLLRAVSHDLRTPLTGIIGSGAVIAENAGILPPDEIKKMATNIQDDANWLVNVIENMLSITRVNSSAANVVKTDEVVEEIIATAIGKIKKRYLGVDIIAEPNDDIIVVPMDALLIEQVLINLMENSIKHAGDYTYIKVRFYLEDANVIIEVSDDGIGLPYDNLEALIEAKLSERVDFSDGIKNAGIGLSVCRSIIAAHGGVLEGNNLESGGAVFRFSIPLLK